MTELFIAASTFSAGNLTLFQTTSPDFKIWSADIKACIPLGNCRVFEGILFVESGGSALILGIENQDGRPDILPSEKADGQKAFIDYLRAETRKTQLMLGQLAPLFKGSEYACEVRTTAAFIAAMGVDLKIALGYLDRDFKYDCIRLEDSSSWIDDANLILPYHELGSELRSSS